MTKAPSKITGKKKTEKKKKTKLTTENVKIKANA